MASYPCREEQLGFLWELDVACRDLGDGELNLTGQVVHYELSRRGAAKLTLNSTDNASRFQIIGPAADGNVRISIRIDDQTDLLGGLVYRERIWTQAAGADPTDQAAGTVHVRA